MQAPRITYTIREGSVEEKEEEAWTSFWKTRNFRPLPGTSGPRNLRPSRNFRPRRIEAVRECANSLDSPDLGRTFARTFLPSSELPALPARRDLTRGHVPFRPSLTPSWLLLYILIPLLHSRVSKYDSSFLGELFSYHSTLEREKDYHSHGVQDLHVRRSCGISSRPSRGKIRLGYRQDLISSWI